MEEGPVVAGGQGKIVPGGSVFPEGPVGPPRQGRGPEQDPSGPRPLEAALQESRCTVGVAQEDPRPHLLLVDRPVAVNRYLGQERLEFLVVPLKKGVGDVGNLAKVRFGRRGRT